MANSNNNYVDNKKMYDELVKYNDSVKLYNEDKSNPQPRVNNYLGECFILIANNLATRPQFVNYIFKDEMVADSIENCLTYIHNFDDKKYNNPFAYFTQIIYYAFLRRIYKEKRQLYIKHKTSENNYLFEYEHDEEFFDVDVDSRMFANNIIDNHKMNNIVKGFEENLTRKKNKRKKEA
jgi:hypothetical protein